MSKENCKNGHSYKIINLSTKGHSFDRIHVCLECDCGHRELLAFSRKNYKTPVDNLWKEKKITTECAEYLRKAILHEIYDK